MQRKVLAFALAFLLLASAFSAMGESYPPMEGEAALTLEREFETFRTQGACVAAFANGEITGVYCYGTCWIGGDEITPDTGFLVGSISKLVSAVGLMKLLEDSSYTLEDEIGDILGFPIRHPEYPDIPITLRQLLTHTASLRDSGDYNSALQGKAYPLTTVFGRKSGAAFLSGVRPGSMPDYSNFGGGLIGSLIERLSGRNVDTWMKEAVFEPLGITAAYHAGLLQGKIPLADLYDTEKHRLNLSFRGDTSLPEEADPMTHYHLTAGKLMISAPDLCKILMLLCDGGVVSDVRILRESTVEEMLTPQNWRGSVDCESGGGLIVRIVDDVLVDGRRLYGHGGKSHGMLCAAYFDPNDRTGVVMLTNGCNADVFYQGIGLLSRRILSAVYQYWLEPGHQTEDPFRVE